MLQGSDAAASQDPLFSERPARAQVLCKRAHSIRGAQSSRWGGLQTLTFLSSTECDTGSARHAHNDRINHRNRAPFLEVEVNLAVGSEVHQTTQTVSSLMNRQAV
jgi:hypothetical protein